MLFGILNLNIFMDVDGRSPVIIDTIRNVNVIRYFETYDLILASLVPFSFISD